MIQCQYAVSYKGTLTVSKKQKLTFGLKGHQSKHSGAAQQFDIHLKE